ncbi:MAG: hypothetical protein IPH13_01030 [Planctomycetes bacterium]|nr:hypothetical protein [Planctomycetota bacterium]MCC7171130.1 hypothetical protein [Planctomycetota bacterium]
MLPILALLVIESVLRVCGCAPPPDPAVLHAASSVAGFDPFVEDGTGRVTIRPEWVARGNALVVREGDRPGEFRLIPAFRETEFRARKYERMRRVFVLGGSSTFGLYVDRDASYPSVLQQRFTGRSGEPSVEVVNLGCAGFASDRCAELLTAVLAYEPDAIVVDCGHNEMLALAVEEPMPSPTVRAWRSRLAVSYLFGWLRAAWVGDANATRLDSDRLGELAIFDPSMIPESTRAAPSRESIAAAEETFRASLRAIAAATAAKGVPCVFVLPAPNLFAPPYAPAPVTGQALTTEVVIPRVIEALRNGDVNAAIATADALLAQAPQHPVGHYLKGLAFADAGDANAARRELELAVDFDARPHRITSGLASAMIDVARDAGVAVVDEREFLLRRVDRVAASELFVDHCHPTAAGHRSIAAAIDAVLSPLLETR